MTITIDEATALINEKRQQEEKRHLKTFDEDKKPGGYRCYRYGPYLLYDGKNYRLPKNMHPRATELTYEECMDIIKASTKKK